MGLEILDQFDDSILKAAIQRICGREQAPPPLRQRIARLLNDATGQAPMGLFIGPSAARDPAWMPLPRHGDSALLPAGSDPIGRLPPDPRRNGRAS